MYFIEEKSLLKISLGKAPKLAFFKMAVEITCLFLFSALSLVPIMLEITFWRSNLYFYDQRIPMF